MNSLVNFHRNNNGVNYPYTTPGLLSIKRSTATDNNGLDHYYFYYDWEVKKEECESGRREVIVRVDECNGFTDLSEIAVYPNPNNGSFVIRIPRYSEGTLGVYNILGQMIHEESFYIEAESKEMMSREPFIDFVWLHLTTMLTSFLGTMTMFLISLP